METATIDHIRCVCDGGSDWDGNLLPCCLSCNRQRGDKNAHSWLQSCTDRGLKVRKRVVKKALKRIKDIRSINECWKAMHRDHSTEEMQEIEARAMINFGVDSPRKSLRTENMLRMRASAEFAFGRTQHSLQELYHHHPEYFQPRHQVQPRNQVQPRSAAFQCKSEICLENQVQPVKIETTG